MTNETAVKDKSQSNFKARTMRQASWKMFLKKPEAGAFGGAIAVFIFFLAIAPSFRQLDPFFTVLYQSATIGIPAVAISLLMIGGEFDLSAGVAVTTSSLSASIFATEVAGNLWVGVIFALFVSLSIGWLNGFLLIKTKLHSFLVTLSTFLMLEGLNIAVTKLLTGNVATGDISRIPGFDSAHAVFATNFRIAGINVSIIIFYWIFFIIIASWMLMRTRFGNWTFAVGGSDESARAVGVPVRKMKIGLFMLVGFSVWFLGMHMLFEYNTVQSGAGGNNALLYIAAAVVGGCLLTGGYGSAIGSGFGAFIFGMTTEGVIYADWNSNWFMFFVGATLLVATIFNNWVRQRVSGGK